MNKKLKSEEEHYIDNKLFYKAMKEFRTSCNKAKRDKQPRPPINDYVGSCIMKIAYKLSNKPNFINYPFKEDMIADGIENAVQYIANFNPSKSKNPFAYFTTIVYYAFLRRIEKEKKVLYTKYKAIDNIMTSEFYESNKEYGDVIGAPTQYCSENAHDYMNEFVKNFEAKREAKKLEAASKKKKKPSLEEFLE